MPTTPQPVIDRYGPYSGDMPYMGAYVHLCYCSSDDLQTMVNLRDGIIPTLRGVLAVTPDIAGLEDDHALISDAVAHAEQRVTEFFARAAA